MSNSTFIQLAPAVYVPVKDVKTFSVAPMGAFGRRRGILTLTNGLWYSLEQYAPYSSITVHTPEGDILEVRVRDEEMFEKGFAEIALANYYNNHSQSSDIYQEVNVLTEEVVRRSLAPILNAMDAVTEPEVQEMSSAEEDMDSSSDWEPTKQGRRPHHVGRRRAREAARLRAERAAAAEEKADPTWAPPRPRRPSSKKSYDSDSDWEPAPKRQRLSARGTWAAIGRAYLENLRKEENAERAREEEELEANIEKWRQEAAERMEAQMERRSNVSRRNSE